MTTQEQKTRIYDGFTTFQNLRSELHSRMEKLINEFEFDCMGNASIESIEIRKIEPTSESYRNGVKKTVDIDIKFNV